MLVPALGGPERNLGEVRIDILHLSSQFFLSWTPDGKWLVACDGAHGQEPAGLFLLSPDTGERRRLTTGSSLSPAFSSDGRKLAFVRERNLSSDVYLISLSGDFVPQGDPQRLTLLNETVASPAWTPDGREIVFSSGAHLAQRSLWRITASPGSSPRREPLGEDSTNLTVSRNGRRLAYVRQFVDTDIWRIGLGGRTEVSSSAAKLISSTRHDYLPDYSPDGKRIVFNSHRSGT